MIELHETIIPMIFIKVKKWIIKLVFIVEYQPPPVTMFP